MANSLAEYRTFFREFRQNFETTGSILPSSRFLAHGLARYVMEPAAKPRRILEVGPGTGAVTTTLVQRMGPEDRLDLVELNDEFVAVLRKRFEVEPALKQAADRVRIFHQPVETLIDQEQYDVLVSGLPLNNFSASLVRSILDALRQLAGPGGRLSFFEYAWLRGMRCKFGKGDDRDRLRDVSQVLNELFQHEVRRDTVWLNVPPAWVHHIEFPA